MPYLSQKISKNPQQTQDFARKLGNQLPGGTILSLSGELGSGKTQFVQGLAKGLQVTGPIQSPSFVLMKVYPLTKKEMENFYHLDLYRLDTGQLDQPALMEIINDHRSIVAIEWAEKIKNWLPQDQTIFLNLFHLSPEQRKIKISCPTR